MNRDLLYIRIARTIEDQIGAQTLRIGDKLPSIRSIQKIYNVSINTARQAFSELESRSLIESRPKSGYYVSNTSQRKMALPSASQPSVSVNGTNPDDLFKKVFMALADKSVTQLALGIPDAGMLPIAKLNKSMVKVLSTFEGSGTAMEPAQGSINLRRNIAKWSYVLEGKITEADLVTTAGTTSAIYHCLTAVTKPGDTIATESPVYFGILQLAKSIGLNVIELPTHPVTGIDLHALQNVIHKIQACCFTTNFNNPLGSLMPDENKKELVALLTAHNIPMIEDDLFGNLFFGSSRPKPCKVFDQAGIVMWCGGVSKTLAPGYRVGWIAPGKFKDQIIWQKLVQNVAIPSLQQEAIADFLEHGRYDHYLRKLRQTLYTNCLKFQRAIEQYFPKNTKISQPQGGLFLWLELNGKIDTAKVLDVALKHKISFAPGRMFTQHNQFHNCMRLNFALVWTEKLEQNLKKLGEIICQLDAEIDTVM
ncbi:PLP-dependent aminotransferase family protein [Pedobacter sp. AW1-32]|uniref:aminotransferase-like domain-containing protein n=1 Tax=Pedobacter sp. AW1-32 TaxID=3383026 RepID=UPI003FF02421